MCLFFLKKQLIYVSYTLDKWSTDLDTGFTLGNCSFGAVKLAKDTDPDKYKYSKYGIGFDSCSQFSELDGSYGKNVIIFGVGNSSSVHINGKNRNILVFGEGPTQSLEDAIITSKAKYSINFTESGKRFVLSLHYNRSESFLFVNTVKMYQFRAKDSEIKPYPSCLSNIYKDFTLDNMKKTGLKGNVWAFSVDYDLINTSKILDIYRFLMKET